MKKLILLISIAALTGCSSLPKKIAEVKATLDELDKLGVTEIDAPGRVTSTTYRRVEKDGKYVSTITHNNPYLSMPVRIVRERTKEEDSK